MSARFYYLLVISLFPALSWAQLSDDFQDGNLQDPDWFGLTDRFDVAGGQLQLQDAGNSSPSYLYLPAFTSTASETTWEFFVSNEFSPSTNNNTTVYLSASNPDLTGPQEGYFVRIGGISGSDDAVELFRQDGSTTTSLISGTLGQAAVNPVVRIRVVRSTAGEWSLFADYTGGTNYMLEGTATDATYSEGAFFGFLCKYTSSNATDAFFFDDVLVDPLQMDTDPPVLEGAIANAATEVEVVFDELLDAVSAQTAANYSINGGIGTPSNAQLVPGDGARVRLTLAAPLTNQEDYTVTTNNIADLNGNASGSQSADFTYLVFDQPALYDVLINEIMPDPSPPAGQATTLPDSIEFIELYNPSDKVLNLEGWTFSDGGTPVTFGSFALLPGSFVIVCAAGNANAMAAYGQVAALPSFPGLNNDGDNLELRDPDGNLIDQVHYTDDWYQDPDKDEGGYTLERINPLDPCEGASNWRASEDPSGGTPGLENSVQLALADTEGPVLIGAEPGSDLFSVELLFSENIDPASAEILSNYSVSPDLTIIDAEVLSERPDIVRVSFAAEIEPQVPYIINISAGVVEDCLGNANTAAFSQPFGLAGAYDVLITEIMANPPSEDSGVRLPGAEYVELYNPSDQAVNLNNWQLFANTSNGTFPTTILEPGAYLIVCDAANVDSFLTFGQAVGLGSFPGITNSGSNIQLRDPRGILVYKVDFNLDWYQSSSKASEGGWSLEMINPTDYCEGASNWRASEDLLGGTPGKQNSVFDDSDPGRGPSLRAILPPDNPFQITVLFSEDLDGASALNAGAFTISDGVTVSNVSFDQEFADQLRLELTPALSPGVIYTLSIGNTITDCQGTPANTERTLRFGIPSAIEEGEIIINEVLPFPEVGGVDFIELYNTTTDKIFDLNDLVIGNLSEDQDTSVVDPISAFCFPGEYVVLTESRSDILGRYTVPVPENLLLVSDLPSFPSDLGNVTIYTRTAENNALIIDAFDYSEDLHNTLLDEPRGVSLERLDPAAPTNDPANWQSAARAVGYATPTGENSQLLPGETPEDSPFELASQTFSPDGDGFEDILSINYTLEQPGFIANVRIFDAQGRQVKDLLQNELLGTRGTMIWEGDTDEGSRARIGIYVIWIELFQADGTVAYYQLTSVLAGQF